MTVTVDRTSERGLVHAEQPVLEQSPGHVRVLGEIVLVKQGFGLVVYVCIQKYLAGDIVEITERHKSH
jgi:hypothetical protein